MYNYTIGYETAELAGMSVEEIAAIIRSVQAGLSDTEPRMSEAEIMSEASAIYEEANQDF